jgi:lipoprotein NlpI
MCCTRDIKLTRFTWQLLNTLKDEAKVYKARGQVFNDLEAYHRAVKDFDKALSLEPGKGEVHYYRGIAHKHLG